MKKTINKILKYLGYQIIKYPQAPRSNIERKMRLIRLHGINKILDVGANVGQFAIGLRQLGFLGDIISFEPLYDAFEELMKLSELDSAWQAVDFAHGDQDGDKPGVVYRAKRRNILLLSSC